MTISFRSSAVRPCRFLRVVIRDIISAGFLDDGEGGFPTLFKSLEQLTDYLERSLMDDPSILLTEDRLIRDGWDTETDRMRLVREERLSGKALLFRLRSNRRVVRGDYVVLDDVSPTGMTLNAFGNLLKSYGADRVFGLVVCRN